MTAKKKTAKQKLRPQRASLSRSAGSDVVVACSHCGRGYSVEDLLSVAGEPWCDPCAWKVWRDRFPKFVIPNIGRQGPLEAKKKRTGNEENHNER